ncbi:MAG: MXAN_6577-like cysteine-rich protein [Deltaproteobacteria bacterium]
MRIAGRGVGRWTVACLLLCDCGARVVVPLGTDTPDAAGADTAREASTADVADAPPCAPPQMPCDGVCADLATDVTHCGACGRRCPAGAVCTGGACGAIGCAGGELRCQGLCVAVAADNANCGACGRVCRSGDACIDGACQLVCPSGQALCAGRCADLRTDVYDCGACGRACAPGQVCQLGMCGGR